ncbi:2-amino-4-hydroxy-6-hydroxymethyldihydropteridine diphosphokinase [Planctomonas psychrotolerans]|uniref:2-amino-4-hydroxy-6- hydroxymethyldihydropteridine diphosphokinase n=1 Tax=Planctomonas psychrotolerans TaxID=2528712 RepID=UPI001D0CF415|nr:2-amino-4-hydroxy-6-hydroxymethyldihydropteridine diphosphokinase [Planctomonas psychrotolerans]
MAEHHRPGTLDPHRELDSITLTGIRARGFHGVYDSERAEGQDFVVDATVWLDFASAAASDSVENTVHYGVLAEEIAAAIAGDPVDLIETLAERIAAVALAHAAVHRVRITVHKPSAPITVPFDDVSVTITRDRPAHTAVLALGSNLGDRESSIRGAVRDLSATPGIRVRRVSDLLETPALTLTGVDESAPAYLNAVAIIDTTLDPLALLDALHGIEHGRGRVRTTRWANRTLDIDIVTYDAVARSDERLTLPHPRAAERDFVLAPWLQVDPHAELPGHGPVADLLAALDRAAPTGNPGDASRPGDATDADASAADPIPGEQDHP